ncbi:hypothetical protein SFC43_34555 [Bacteroides sp. CR5/BHMF/2]|nr:hypothetical protein [Bacteroides sp. CR5/BHMF/2]
MCTPKFRKKYQKNIERWIVNCIKTRRGGMSYEALRGKYLEKLTRLKEQADALVNTQTGDVKTEEKKELVKCLKRMENNIFKLTTAQELLKQPRTKLVADSLRATTQDSEGYTKSSQIMRNYQNTLMRRFWIVTPEKAMTRFGERRWIPFSLS